MTNSKRGVKGFIKSPATVRFLAKAGSPTQKGCWEWSGYVTQRGYGQIWDGEKNVSAHRFSYELYKGKIPDGKEIDHVCENTRCVNPDHLEAVTHSENISRATYRMDYENSRKTHCKHGHLLEGDNLRPGQNGRRQCRECARKRDRKRRAALAKAKGEQA